MDINCVEKIISNDYADFIIEYRSLEEELRKLEGLVPLEETCNAVISENLAVLYIPVSVPMDSVHEKFGYDTTPALFALTDVGSQEASGITRVRNIPNLNLMGEGVLVGFIDTGIDYTHPAFKNADGTSRILSIWDQTIQTGPIPLNLMYGTEYTREQINEALASENPLSVVPSEDENGHGTFLAGITAGTPSDIDNFAGIVPLSDIVVVKLKEAKAYLKDFFAVAQDILCFQENDIMFGLKYLVQVANQLSRPISICIGLGTSLDSHDGRGALSSYLEILANENGTAISISAGNEGNTGNHYHEVIPVGTGQSRTIELRVAANEEPGFTMMLWGDAPATYSIDILSPTGEYIPRIPARIGEFRDIRFIFERTVIRLAYFLIEAQTGDEMIFMRFRSPTEGIWRFKVYTDVNLSSNFHIWLPGKVFLKGDTAFVQPDPDYTVTTPGNTRIPIVATAYDYTNNSRYIAASRGFTRDERIVPSFAAPGVNLIGPTPGGGYTTKTGTSVAAAHTTGVAAIILQWGNSAGYYMELGSLEIKNLLIRGAKRDTNLTYPNKEWGFGILDLYNTFNSFRQE